MQGFDPVFFLYFEETDLQFRLRETGRQAYLINGPRIRHEQGQSLAGAPRRLRVLYRDSLLRYVRKHQSGTRYASFLFLWNLLDAKTLMQKLLLTIKPEQP
jgi:GT2 family glycosyltransferase